MGLDLQPIFAGEVASQDSHVIDDTALAQQLVENLQVPDVQEVSSDEDISTVSAPHDSPHEHPSQLSSAPHEDPNVHNVTTFVTGVQGHNAGADFLATSAEAPLAAAGLGMAYAATYPGNEPPAAQSSMNFPSPDGQPDGWTGCDEYPITPDMIDNNQSQQALNDHYNMTSAEPEQFHIGDEPRFASITHRAH